MPGIPDSEGVETLHIRHPEWFADTVQNPTEPITEEFVEIELTEPRIPLYVRHPEWFVDTKQSPAVGPSSRPFERRVCRLGGIAVSNNPRDGWLFMTPEIAVKAQNRLCAKYPGLRVLVVGEHLRILDLPGG